MADEKEDKNKKDESVTSTGSEKPILFIILACVNMLVVISIGLMLFLSRKKEDPKGDMHEMMKAEEAAEHGKKEADHLKSTHKLIPLETFLVNLSQSHGRKLVKVSIDLDVTNDQVIEEIDIKKPVIRDIIITILSSKTYLEISTKEGKENLREEIKNQVNLSLPKGGIRGVYFTEFIYN